MSSPIASAAPDVLRPMPPATADYATVWAFLEGGLDQIMAATNVQTDVPTRMGLYTVAYNYCTSSRRHNITGDTAGGGNRTGANLMGSDLYNSLIRYFILHLEQLKDESNYLQDQAFLRYYAAEWDRYERGANSINRSLIFLNRHWVKRERDEGRKGVYPVYTLALMQWKIHFFVNVQSKLTGSILRLFERGRKGETIDQGLVKKVVDSFVLLGLDETDIKKACLDIYKDHLEAPFLDDAEKYYEREPEPFLAEGTLSDHLRRAEERVKEEEDRVDRCLRAETREHLVRMLIRQHFKLIWERNPSLHDFDRDDDLQKMHAFLSRTPEDLEPLAKKFEGHVTKTGLATVARLLGERSDGVDSLDLKAYVDTLLEVHRNNLEIVTRSFSGVAGLVAALDKACKEVVNRNAATGSSTTKSPELLVKYVDTLLRKSNQMAEEDLEGQLNRAMVLFNYIEDKDIFHTFYATKLCKRLINGISHERNEVNVISKLKEAGGFEYANKLQKMITDTIISKDLTDQFKSGHDDMNVNFSIMVLGHSWPLSVPNNDFIIPPEILPTYDSFTAYYQTKHSGRKLTWLWNYSKNELRTNYLNQKYILMTSSYQMAVLLQYNKHDMLSLEELIAATAISKEVLSQVLTLLIRAKVLIKKEAEQYNLNPNFQAKKIRVNLNQPIKAEVKAESSEVLRTVNDDRKHVIQATIVRIIKAHKTMKNQLLIQEVISQISQRFPPKIPDIKKAIDTLLEKEYIERVDGARDTFAYVA